jgi:D-tagatose-1,6-bisphosphate aldolase subunit GatZ/KbaZ
MFLDEIVAAQKRGERRGIVSICSANPWVLQTAMQRARHGSTPLLIEATCNQVNQFGGYTGMTPSDFVRYLRGLAEIANLPGDGILLGGDHLGPLVWQNDSEIVAMRNSQELITAYVQAGFHKIHLDCSMRLADDPPGPLSVGVAAQRAAQLAQTAEKAHAGMSSPAPRYVIGTEVPAPGGAQAHQGELTVTTPSGADETIVATRKAFEQMGLHDAWERVIAVVVQPGVEYGGDFVAAYQPEKALELVRFIEATPNLIYEAHSTDYQTPQALANLVRDHFAILKVGPALTFAFREAVFALAWIENELVPRDQRSNLIEIIEAAMLAEPQHWEKHYPGDKQAQATARKFSFSDRIRYYWPVSTVQTALRQLLGNLEQRPLPLTLLSQFLPEQYGQVRAGEIPPLPPAIIQAKIGATLDSYRMAV